MTTDAGPSEHCAPARLDLDLDLDLTARAAVPAPETRMRVPHGRP
ncbi:hypothetical protein [Streptomyces mirabilis]|nr:hypothetical protein [Streptomyces mirabilis]